MIEQVHRRALGLSLSIKTSTLGNGSVVKELAAAIRRWIQVPSTHIRSWKRVKHSDAVPRFWSCRISGSLGCCQLD